MPLQPSEPKYLDRNHRVDAETWNGHTHYYPMHFSWGFWRYYEDNTSWDGHVSFMFEDTALRHLRERMERGH